MPTKAPHESQNVDIAVVGGGPAGMSAALWCHDLGLDCVVIDKGSSLGGQLRAINNPIQNYLGVAAQNGPDLLSRFVRSLEPLDLKLELGCDISQIDLTHRIVRLRTREYSARAVILAMGVRRRNLDLPDETSLYGRGLMRSGVGERNTVAGQTVIIVGGGDAALENAVLLSDTAARVVIVHRRDRFTARTEFVQQALSRSNIEVMFEAEVIKWHLDEGGLTGVEVADRKRSHTMTIDASRALVRIGVIPNSEDVEDQVDLDDDGYVVIDHRCETSLPSIFAVGDLAFPFSPTISSATGSAATAVRAAYDSFLSNKS